MSTMTHAEFPGKKKSLFSSCSGGCFRKLLLKKGSKKKREKNNQSSSCFSRLWKCMKCLFKGKNRKVESWETVDRCTLKNEELSEQISAAEDKLEDVTQQCKELKEQLVKQTSPHDVQAVNKAKRKKKGLDEFCANYVSEKLLQIYIDVALTADEETVDRCTLKNEELSEQISAAEDKLEDVTQQCKELKEQLVKQTSPHDVQAVNKAKRKKKGLDEFCANYVSEKLLQIYIDVALTADEVIWIYPIIENWFRRDHLSAVKHQLEDITQQCKALKDKTEELTADVEKKNLKVEKKEQLVKQASPHDVEALVLNVTTFLEPVKVNVYYIPFILNRVLEKIGIGIYHTAVEVFNVEVSFYEGITEHRPDYKRKSPYQYKESIHIGYTKLKRRDVKRKIKEMSEDFGEHSYNLIHRNCNHFSAAFVQALCGKRIPNWINRPARFFARCSINIS